MSADLPHFVMVLIYIRSGSPEVQDAPSFALLFASMEEPHDMQTYRRQYLRGGKGIEIYEYVSQLHQLLKRNCTRHQLDTPQIRKPGSINEISMWTFI